MYRLDWKIWLNWEVSNVYETLPNPDWIDTEKTARMAIGPRKKTP
jgi:hypothetical protein